MMGFTLNSITAVIASTTGPAIVDEECMTDYIGISGKIFSSGRSRWNHFYSEFFQAELAKEEVSLQLPGIVVIL